MDTRMQFLEHELAVEGREQQRKSSSTKIPVVSSATASPQITRLEHRINALEALVSGLTDEILDLKTVTRKLTNLLDKLGSAAPAAPHAGIRRPQVEPKKDAAAPDPTVVRMCVQAQIPPDGTPEKRVICSSVSQPAAATESPAASQFEYVMQPDGTILKRQKTKGVENVIIAGTGFGKGRLSHSSAIRAKSSSVIEADEVKETVEL